MGNHEAYPLHWPAGRPRTPAHHRQSARFDTRLAVARDGLFAELRLLGASTPILSSNLTLRLDGLPYASQRQPDDAGAAIYFTYRGDHLAFACDRWRRVEDNVQAIRLTIGALRGTGRWGTGDMMKAAFTGFKQLPAPSACNDAPWWEVLGLPQDASNNQIELAYRELAKKNHPDRGGDHKAMARVNKAAKEARKERA